MPNRKLNLIKPIIHLPTSMIFLLLLMLPHKISSELHYKKLDSSEFEKIIPDFSKLKGYSKRWMYQVKDLYYIFYTSKTGEDKIGLVKISTAGLELINAEGDPSNTFLSGVIKPGNEFLVTYCNNPNLSDKIRPQVIGQVDKNKGDVNFYYTNFGYLSTPISGINGPIYSLNYKAGYLSINFQYFYNSCLNIVIIQLGSMGTQVFSYPTINFAEIKNISLKYFYGQFGLFSIIGSNAGEYKVILAAVNTNQVNEQKNFVEIFIDNTDPDESMKCEHTHALLAYSENMLCVNNNEKIKRYKINGVHSTRVTAVKQTKDDAETYFKVYSIAEQDNGGSTFVPSNNFIYFVVEKTQGGPKGIAFCDSFSLKEFHFYQPSENFNTFHLYIPPEKFNSDKFLVDDSFFLGMFPDEEYTGDPYLLYFNFLTYSGVENCKTNAISPKGFFSKQCNECITGKFLENISGYKCLNSGDCTKGVYNDIPSLCHSTTTCSIDLCEKCRNFQENKCLICRVPYAPNPTTFQCEPDCKTHESFQSSSETCFDCLKENHCSDCKDESKECNQCEKGYFLPVGETKKCSLKCTGMFEKNCLDCDKETQVCTECKEGFERDEKDQLNCKKKIEEKKEEKIDCSFVRNCIECSSHLVCDRCREKYKLSEDRKKCYENTQDFLFVNYTHHAKNTDSLSDLTLKLSLSYTNQSEPTTQIFEKRQNIFEIKETSLNQLLPSYTAFDNMKSAYTFINLTEKALSQSELNLEITLSKETIINSYYLINNTETLKIKKFSKIIEPEEPQGFPSIAAEISNPSPAIAIPLIALDPSSALMKLSQYYALINKLIFLNIDFGSRLTPLLEVSARVEKIKVKNRRRLIAQNYFEIQKGSKGKFDKYFVSLELDGKLFWNSVIYAFSWILKIGEILIFKNVQQKKKIKKRDEKIVFVLRKIKFSIFGSCSPNILFFGSRVLLHRKDYIGVKIFLLICFFLISLDLISLIVNMRNIIFFFDEGNYDDESIEEKKEEKINRVRPAVNEEMSESVQVFNLCSDGKIIFL